MARMSRVGAFGLLAAAVSAQSVYWWQYNGTVSGRAVRRGKAIAIWQMGHDTCHT